jgi:hypothetical protein
MIDYEADWMTFAAHRLNVNESDLRLFVEDLTNHVLEILTERQTAEKG